MCYNHMFVDGEFEIINIFLKERRSKYKLAYALNTQHFLHFSCLYWDFSLVMNIWFKVMEKSWKSTGQNVSEPCSRPILHPPWPSAGPGQSRARTRRSKQAAGCDFHGAKRSAAVKSGPPDRIIAPPGGAKTGGGETWEWPGVTPQGLWIGPHKPAPPPPPHHPLGVNHR